MYIINEDLRMKKMCFLVVEWQTPQHDLLIRERTKMAKSRNF